MDFKSKLQSLRKERNFSQEQLADIVGVSRQAVSKWESGLSYPETDKLIEISKLFSISLDELLKEEIVKDKSEIDPNILNEFLSFYKKFSKMIALGVFLCIIGIALTGTISELFVEEYIQIITFFSFILVSVMLFVYFGIEYSKYEEIEKKYKKQIKIIPKNVSRNFAFMTTLAVALCIIGVTLSGVMSEFGNFDYLIPLVLLIPIAIAVYLFIYYGMQYGIYQTETKNQNKLEDKIYSIIMLSATIIFLVIGFLYNIWHPTWVVFVVGGIMCGIVSVIFGE